MFVSLLDLSYSYLSLHVVIVEYAIFTVTRNIVQPGFDRSIAFCNQEKTQRNKESLPSSSHWRSIKQHVMSHGSSRPFSRKHSLDASLSYSREASTSLPAESGSMLVNIPRTTGSEKRWR